MEELTYNYAGHAIVIGCNYHTTWQSHKSMRFVLDKIQGNKARLITRRTKNIFWTDIEDLIFINTPYNKEKCYTITGLRPKILVNNFNGI